jgi:hypothetical protein
LSSALSAALARTAWLAVAGVAIAPLLLIIPKVAESAANWFYTRVARGEVSDGPTVFFEALRS